MIKKILCAFLMIMVSGFANANIHIDGKTVRKIVLEHIDSDHQVPALQEYNVQLKATGNFTMSAAGLYKVCTAAGWDIATPDGKTKCNDFVKALVAESDYKYYEVCGKDKGKSGGTEHCIDNVFDGLLSGIQVTMLQADGLCKEYAKVKYNDDIECSSQKRAGTINKANDYVKCTSKLKPVYYEFKFDDVVESSDSSILRGVLKGVGKIHNVDISDPGCTIERIINDTACNIGYKTTDVKICENLNNSLKRFGYTSKIGNVTHAGLNSEKLCAISGITTISGNLKTAYGIPNDVFYDGLIQMQGSKDVKEGIKQYVTEKIKPEKLTSFECISNTIKMPSIKGKKDNDDVLTCYVNGNQIDFVFDDLSEASKLRQQGAKEAFQCTYNGGLLTGKRCLNVGEEACKKIAQSTFLVQECPECSKLYWDGNICTLPAAATSNVLDKGLNIALIVGGAALNIFVAIGTGGTSTAVGSGLVFIETVGSAIELGTEIKMDIAADNFFVESSKCHDKICAKNLIEKHLQRLSNFYSRLTGAEEKAIDKEMARLFKLIPAEELFTVDALVKVDQENGGKKLASVKDNQKGFFDPKSWEPEQIWQAVGITMQMASLFYQIGSWAFGKSGKTAKAMTEVADVLDDKVKEALEAAKLKGIDPNFTQGTHLEIGDLKTQLQFTSDQLNGVVDAGSRGLLPDVSTAINKDFAQQRGILFMDASATDYMDDLVRQIDSGANTDKLITGVVDMTDPQGQRQLEQIVSVINDGNIKDAVIPFNGPGHQMTIVKQGNNWTVLDQFAENEPDFVHTKQVVEDILARSTPDNHLIYSNKYQVCENTDGTCALFSQGIGRAALDEQIDVAAQITDMNARQLPMNQDIANSIVDQAERHVKTQVERMLKEDTGIKSFLTSSKYNPDISTSSYQDVLRKWNLPADATDDVIEARYKTLHDELFPMSKWKGDDIVEAAHVNTSVNSDYDIIKRTKPSYLKSAIVSEQTQPTMPPIVKYFKETYNAETIFIPEGEYGSYLVRTTPGMEKDIADFFISNGWAAEATSEGVKVPLPSPY